MDNSHPVYSYQHAQISGGSFQKWWENFVKIWNNEFPKTMIKPDPNHMLPYFLKENACMNFFEGKLCTNSLGFVGPEFNKEKMGTFRIMAIGESTTMGIPISKNYKPWPLVLQHLINSHLQCVKPIEIINAGVAGFSLKDNIFFLKNVLIEFQPDIILSYHGFNGFYSIEKNIPTIMMKNFKNIDNRPSLFLSRLEKWWAYRNFFNFSLGIKSGNNLSSIDYMKTEMAFLLEELAKFSKDQGVNLFFLTFNMAVDDNSPISAINFYKQGFPIVERNILHNKIQNLIMQDVAQKYSYDIINTSQNLNGTYNQNNFIDLIHFTNEGDKIMAANVYKNIEQYLMSNSELQCRKYPDN